MMTIILLDPHHTLHYGLTVTVAGADKEIKLTKQDKLSDWKTVAVA